MRFSRAVLFLFVGSRVWAFDSIQLKRQIAAPPDSKKFQPISLAVGPHQELWAVDDYTHKLQLFSPAGDWLKSVGGEGKQLGQFDEPHAVAVGPNGDVFVADSGNRRIQRLDTEGKPLGAFGEHGSGPGQLDTPWTVAVSQDGLLLVGEKDRSRVQIFTRDGVYLRGFDTGAPVDSLAVDETGRVYVTHTKARTVAQWTSQGERLQTWTGAEPGVKPFSEPVAAAITKFGLLYVCDPDEHKFREMDLSGHTLGAFGRKGSGDGQFKKIASVAVDADTIYIGDTKLRRITVLNVSRSAALLPMTPAPLTRLQLTKESVINADAERMAMNADGSIVAISASHDKLLKFDKAGQLLDTLDLRKLLGVKNAGGITVAPSSGNLFLADTGGHRVLKLDPKGKKLLEIGKSKHFFKSGEGDLSAPQGVTCSDKGVLFVADTGNSRFQAFNHQGLYQFASGGGKKNTPGEMRNPLDIAWDHDRIYVVDAGSKRVLQFGPSGRYLGDLTPPAAEAFVEPRRVQIDKEGDVFVLDAARGRIVAFDAQGQFVGALGRAGKTDGTFDKPRSVQLADDGAFLAATPGRIQKYRLVLLPPAPQHLQATPGEGFVTLKWDAVHSRSPMKYALYRGAPGVEAKQLKEVGETTATDDSLKSNTTYSYMVMAKNVQGTTGAPSEPVVTSAKPMTGPRLEIVDVQIDDVFSAHYKYYSRTPFGQVRIRNNGEGPVQKIKVSFAIQGYMDYPSETSIDELHIGEEKDVPLQATFNNRILEVNETTPIQAQLKCSFYAGDQEKSFVRHLPFKLYSRNTVRWDKHERIAAFITPNDPTIVDFARGVVTPFAERHRGAPMPSPIQTAWALFEGLGTYGISYAARPNNPYDRVSLDSSTVDTLQFARETLSRKSGDCADVVALLASMLESMTVTTAALDAPGHIFLMFDTGETNLESLGLPENLVVLYAGSYWIPLEATMLGSSFLDAWKKGAEEYRRFAQRGKLTPIDTHIAWRTFEPATLPEMASGVRAPERDAVEAKFLSDWKALVDLRWQTSEKRLKESSLDGGEKNLQLGFLAVDFHRFDEAKQFFNRASQEKSAAAAAFNNLGNLALLQNNAAGAEQAYEKAASAEPKDAQISLNLSRAHLKQSHAQPAAAAYENAMKLDASLREVYPDVSSLSF